MSIQDTIEQINNLDINDIDWSRVGVWPLIGRIAVWVAAVIAVLVIAYIFYIQGMQNSLKQETQKEQTLKTSFQQKVFQAATLDQHVSLMQQMETDFEFLVAQLPKKTQVPGLLDDIDERGRESGLKILSIKLQPEQNGEFYVTLTIEIVVEGSYHNLGNFVSGIASMPRIVTLHDFSIAKGANPSNLKMTITAKTYRSSDDEV